MGTGAGQVLGVILTLPACPPIYELARYFSIELLAGLLINKGARMKKVHQRLNKMNRENRLLYKKELRAAMNVCDKLGARLQLCLDHMDLLNESRRACDHRTQRVLVANVYNSLLVELLYIEEWEKEKAGVKEGAKYANSGH